jgi:hypothetical protein
VTSSPDEKPEAPRIEMEPLHLREVSRYAAYSAPLPGSHLVDTGPIPEKPEHRCPKCDYILAGLTSRRCPECGEPYTLLEARMREAMRSEHLEEVEKYVGLGMLFVSVELQNLLASGAGWLTLSSRGFLMLVFMIPLSIGVIILKVVREEGWSYACWVAGLVAMIVSGILAIM